MTETPSPPGSPGTLRFLALGDSYTIGEGVGDAERWPVRLAAALRAEGTAAADPEIVATTGWTVAELDAGIDAARPQGPYALVTLLVGVNDQYRGGDAEAYRAEFRAMLARAAGFAGGDARRVVVVSIPDWGVTPFAQSAGRDRGQVSRQIDQYNAAAESACRLRGVYWVDITDLTRHRDHSHWLVADGLHPSADMYRKWVERINRVLP